MWNTSEAEASEAETSVSVKMLYEKDLLPQDFHMPGIEPYIAGALKQHKLGLVLDIGVGAGFWGFLIRSYLTRGKCVDPTIIGIDLSADKLYQLKEMRIYDGLVCADIKHPPFRTESFDTIIAVESLYISDFQRALAGIEVLARGGGLIIFSRGLDQKVRKDLLSKGYEITRVYVRGLMLKRFNDGNEVFADKGVKRFSLALKLFYKMFKPKARNYVIALKRTCLA